MPKFHSWKCYVLLFCILLTSFSACKKAKKTTIYDFTYSGSSYAGNTTHFVTTPSSGSSFMWNFGDSNTSTSANPDHVFSVAGAYNVSLVVNGDTAHTIRKTLKIGFDSLLMASITGSRIYHHKLVNHAEGITDSGTLGAIDRTTTFADTTITIKQIDAMTLLFGVDTVVFNSSVTGAYYFDYFFVLTSSEPSFYALFFYNLSNKISFYRQTHLGAGQYEDDMYDNP